jgi:hypothetical protein
MALPAPFTTWQHLRSFSALTFTPYSTHSYILAGWIISASELITPQIVTTGVIGKLLEWLQVGGTDSLRHNNRDTSNHRQLFDPRKHNPILFSTAQAQKPASKSSSNYAFISSISSYTQSVVLQISHSRLVPLMDRPYHCLYSITNRVMSPRQMHSQISSRSLSQYLPWRRNFLLIQVQTCPHRHHTWISFHVIALRACEQCAWIRCRLQFVHGTRVLTPPVTVPILRSGMECNYLDARKAHTSCWSPRSLTTLMMYTFILLFLLTRILISQLL